MENNRLETNGIDGKHFETIEKSLSDLRDKPDDDSKMKELITQVVQLNKIASSLFDLVKISAEHHNDSANLFMEHKEMLDVLGEKIKDVYTHISEPGGTTENLLQRSNPVDGTFSELSTIIDLHTIRLDTHDQHLESIDKHLEAHDGHLEAHDLQLRT